MKREDAQDVFYQSEHHRDPSDPPGNVADALFYIGDQLRGIKEALEEWNNEKI